jgi:hypothetical protein
MSNRGEPNSRPADLPSSSTRPHLARLWLYNPRRAALHSQPVDGGFRAVVGRLALVLWASLRDETGVLVVAEMLCDEEVDA